MNESLDTNIQSRPESHGYVMPTINRESSNRIPNSELTPNVTKIYTTGQNTNVNTSRVIYSQLGSKKGDVIPKIQIDAVD